MGRMGRMVRMGRTGRMGRRGGLVPPNIAPENIIICRPIRASTTGEILSGAKGRMRRMRRMKRVRVDGEDGEDREDEEEGEESWEATKDACMYGARIHIATQSFEHARTP